VPRADESERVAALLERLLTDGEFRRRFRRSPATACREWGLEGVAEELEAEAGGGFQTLELRESKSSLAGVLAAAAAEGVGAVELLRYLHSSQALSPDVAAPVHQALTSPKLQAVAPEPSAPEQHAQLAAATPADAAPVSPAMPPVHEHASAGAVAENVPASASADPVHELAERLLNDPHVQLSANAQHDLAAGVVDVRLEATLLDLSAHHDIGISVIKSGHDEFVHGTTNISNHYYGRALDISTVDGRPVDATNEAAREVAVALGQLDPSIRPTEIGSPWPIDGPEYFSDADHENHIHVGFDTPAPAHFEPSEAAAAPAAAAPAAAAHAEQAGPVDTMHGARAVDPASHASAGSADAASVLPDGSDVYPGDNAPQEQIAAWMARQAHKAGLPGELPVMASLVESGLHNVQGGDRDSVGFFQMRTGIWDEGPYKGFEHRPELQLKWFIDHALAVKQERLAHGDRAFMRDSSKWGDWIADVERPAEQYRGRYQLRLGEARGLLHSAGPPEPSPAAASAAVAEHVPAPAAAPTDARALAAIAVARRFLGTPYQWGGNTPSTGFDCSGLVQWAYKQVGVDLPRVTYTQVNVGEHIDRAHLRPGDILFFRDSTGDIHHEALYIGGGKFIHAPHTGDVVKISSLDEPYYSEQFMGGRRVAQLAAAGAPLPHVPGAEAAAAAPAHSASEAPAPAAAGGSSVLPAVQQPSSAGVHNTVKFLPAVDPQQHPAHAAAAPSDSADAATAVPSGPDAYPGNDAPREQIAAWMARKAKEAGLPPELPVMASLVESGLKNEQFGDADSIGFFQMRVGIWDEGPYKGFEHNPELQLKWFLDHALAVKQERLANGDREFLQDPSKWGDWIADVERPAEQYRGRYQLRLDEARSLLEGR
jgi:cell wall-associated NlpC family hydrolase